jgi:hypothetical protein
LLGVKPYRESRVGALFRPTRQALTCGGIPKGRWATQWFSYSSSLRQLRRSTPPSSGGMAIYGHLLSQHAPQYTWPCGPSPGRGGSQDANRAARRPGRVANPPLRGFIEAILTNLLQGQQGTNVTHDSPPNRARGWQSRLLRPMHLPLGG